MISQAGIYQLNLLENKGIVKTKNADGTITAITTQGDTLTFETNANRPEYKNDLDPGNNNVVINEHIKNFILNSLTDDNYNIIEQLSDSIYGWIPVIEFMDNTKYIIQTPFFGSVGKVNTQQAHTFRIELEPRLKSLQELTLYTP